VVDAGKVMCLGQGADLHMAQLLPLPLQYIWIGFTFLILPFWCWLTQIVSDKIQEGRKMVVCVCVHACMYTVPECDSLWC